MAWDKKPASTILDMAGGRGDVEAQPGTQSDSLRSKLGCLPVVVCVRCACVMFCFMVTKYYHE